MNAERYANDAFKSGTEEGGRPSRSEERGEIRRIGYEAALL